MIDNNLVSLRLTLSKKDPAKAEIVRISAEAVDPKNLAVYQNSRFDVIVRPDDPDGVEEEATRTPLADLMAGINGHEAFDQFEMWARQWNLKGRAETRFAPIPVGYDLLNRDWVAYRRYARMFKKERALTGGGCEATLFNNSYRYDLLQILALWAEGSDELTNLSFDAVRKQLGVPREADEVGAISALAIRILEIQRKRSTNTIFAHWFDKEAHAEEKARRQGFRSAEHEAADAKAIRDEKRKNSKWKGNAS